uniref:Tyrosine-protein kinase receptor TYRO3 n=1 Tax=Colobus angolensis palliatus TaxID=336983 RepID=A0A2K5I465_COLAP
MALRRSMGRPGLPLLLPPLGLPLAAVASLLLALVKLTVAQGQLVKLNCSVEGMEEPDIQLVKDGPVIQNLDQLYIPVSKQHWIGFLSLKSVERSDTGQYWCQVENGGETKISQPVWLMVEGVPLFTVEPKDLAVPPNAPFQLSCKAVGPPEPVTIVWWRETMKIGGPAPSPSVLNVTGVTQTHNLKCLASSRIATVHLQALPAAPVIIAVTKLSSSNISVAWMPGTDSCTVQVTQAPGGWESPGCCGPCGPLYLPAPGPGAWSGRSQRSPKPPCHPHRFRPHLGVGRSDPRGPFGRPPGTLGGEQDQFDRLGSPKGPDHMVCVSNAVGCGPWSQPLVVSSHNHAGQQGPPHSRTSWVPVVLGVLMALVTAAALALILLRKRRKETRFGQGFDRVMAQGEPAVYFRAAQSFNGERPECIEATLDSLSINSELKEKLKDVLCPEQQFTLARCWAKESVAQLKQEDADIIFIREAACMKEFDHPHVAKLVGVSLWSRAKGCHPIPMIILPFMKHGDLHTFLLTSQIGENPFTLIRFMVDIACGMEYLSCQNFIRQDLAARNCMLAVDITVCVADFGLSWKIYSGDYYRQGCASKLPVKWLALESLADNLYTVHSDVWAFRVTMWEIMTRGQTPYTGIKNAEIYNYLIGRNRLKQLPEPSDDLLYDLMYQCWSADPKQRPSFTCLILGQLSVLSASQDPLYINIERAEEPTAGGSLELPGGDQPYSGAGGGSGMGAVGGTPRLAEQPGQADHQPELLLLQQGQQPHSSC